MPPSPVPRPNPPCDAANLAVLNTYLYRDKYIPAGHRRAQEFL